MVLVFVGLGLEKGGISLRGIEEAKKADAVYLETYTSIVPGLSVSYLQELTGKKVKVLDRRVLEEEPHEILEKARDGRVVLLIPGDPMVATTHIDLRLRAAKMNVETKIVHAGSILSAVAGVCGLQSYKFGPSATIPFPDNPSARPYEVLADNRKRGFHTLLFLDIRAEEGRVMSANQGMEIMLGHELVRRESIFTPKTLVVVVARAGCEDELVRAGRVEEMLGVDFGPPPHSLVVPGRLHFIEAEALKVFARAPEDAVDELVG
ncbi:MAG: diphthine synthase [Candidatus Hadarchaeales archaeon]